jgi:7-cyano-7-deazaguanine synthase
MPAIVLLSGGLDSAVNAKRALDDTGVGLALTFDYGQRAAGRETAAAALMCHQFGIAHRIVDLPWLAELGRSALVDQSISLPRITAPELDQPRVTAGETARAVWVPNRNGVFVNAAAAFAEAIGADTIVAGFNREEGATFPDNSAEFVDAANASLALSTLSRPKLVSYTLGLTKVEIIGLGRQIKAPIASIWSCYRGGAEHCWECESCARLERALREAGAWEWFHTNRVIP